MKTRTWKKLGIILGVVALILILIAIVTPMLLDLNRYRGLIVAEVEKAVGGQVKLGRISWGISHRIWLEVDGFSIIDASAFPGDVKLTRIYTSISIPALLSKKVVVKHFRLESSEVAFRLKTAAKKPSHPVGEAKSAGVHLPVKIDIRRLAIEIERLELDEALTLPGQRLVHVFSDVKLTANNIAPEEVIAFTLALRDTSPSGLGKLTAQGSFSGLTKALTLEKPDLKVKAALDGLQVPAIAAYLQNSDIKDQLGGRISAKISYEGDLGRNLRASGAIDLSRFTYTNPSLWPTPLPGKDTTFSFEIHLDPENATAEKLSIDLGGLSLDARAVMHGWQKEPVVKNAALSANLPLAEMIPLIPWNQLGNNADLVQSILQGGGEIVIDQLVIPEISLAKPPATVNEVVPGMEMTAEVKGVSVQPAANMPKVEDITAKVVLRNNALAAENVQARLGPIALPTLNIRATNITDHLKVTLRAKGPLQVAASGGKQVEKLLMAHGLKSLELTADVDMRADFDQRRPKEWTAGGTMMLKQVRAEAHPEKIVLKNLEGRVTFNRKKTIDIAADDLKAKINEATVAISGRFSDVGEPNMVITTKAVVDQLNLSDMAAFVPALKKMGLSGQLDMDVDAYFPYALPMKSRFTGTVAARNIAFRQAAADLAVANGNMQIRLAGNTANINTMTLEVNEQKIALSGKISNPVEPKITMRIASPGLNLDRLLPSAGNATMSSPSSKREEDPKTRRPASDKGSGKPDLPPAAREMTADLQVRVDRGQYKELQFEKLKLDLLYKRGVIERYDLNVGIDQGSVASKGSADLRNLGRIGFMVDSDIRALPLDKTAPALGIANLPLTGPLTVKTQLRGRTGNSTEILGSLDGKIDASLGPGGLTKVGKAGDVIAKVSSLAHIQRLFSGRLRKDLLSRGIPFNTIAARTSFDKGMLNIEKLHFDSDAMTIDGQGTIDLIRQTLNLDALLVPVATVDKELNFVPIVGKALEDVTKIQIDIQGPLEDPKIHTAEVKELEKTAEDVMKEPETILEKGGKFLKRIF